MPWLVSVVSDLVDRLLQGVPRRHEMGFLSQTRGACLLVLFAILQNASAQTFQRLGGCPNLGCILPPDQYDTLLAETSLGAYT